MQALSYEHPLRLNDGIISYFLSFSWLDIFKYKIKNRDYASITMAIFYVHYGVIGIKAYAY
jgi:hypothetical protein